MVGKTLSHFRITAKIGEGGMGVVYRADDERLRRTVAIKVLPAELMNHEERRLRFLREAQAAAALNHPNICTIHEVDSQDGVDFLVMELLDGRTLREQMNHCPMPLKSLLPIAMQVGEALAAAHEHRVLHRDLKPENIFITTQGTAKVLDFGLAKVLAPDPGDVAGRGVGGQAAGAGGHVGGAGAGDLRSRIDTMSRELTLQGKVFGTIAYMSPEQARGHATTHQSDLFAFGIVLYEMATGRQPFRGDSDAETLASIIREEPVPAATFAGDIPPELDRIIGKCLEKDLQDRYHHADELVADLRRLRRTTDSGVKTIRTPGTGVTIGARTIDPSAAHEEAAARGRWQPLLLGAGLAIVLAMAATTWWLRRPVVGLVPGDLVVVADFENKTGRPEYDTAPRVAFEHLLAASTFLDVVRGGRLEKLRADRLGDTASRIDRVIAEKLCAGGGCAGYVLGMIVVEPPGYRIDLTLHRLGRQGPVATAHSAAASDQEIVGALHKAAGDLRKGVGESPTAIANSYPPATRSLEAFQIFATAQAAAIENYREQLTLLMRAIQVDPGFADAYEAATVAHQNLGQWHEARHFADEAYRLSADLPQQVRLLREVLALDVKYEVYAEAELLKSYRRLYPLDDGGANWLGWLFLEALDDPAAAEPHLRAAYEINPDLVDLNLYCYSLAHQGKVREIEDLGRDSEHLARVNGSGTVTTFWAAAARDDAMATVQASDRLEVASFGGNLDLLARRTIARLYAGRFVEARDMAQAGLSEVARSNAAPIAQMFFGASQAWLEWRRNGRLPDLSPETIKAAGGSLFILREISLLAEDTRAVTDLKKILAVQEENERGSTSRFVMEMFNMARGTLAQAYEHAGDVDRARQSYTKFVEYWTGADPDIPELVQARARLAALGG